MGTVFDIILFFLFAFMVFWGAYKGAVRTVLGIVALLLAGFLALQIGSYLSPILYQKYFSDSILSAVQANLANEGTVAGIAQQAQAAMDSLPESVRSIAAHFGIDLQAVEAQLSSYHDSGADIAQNIEGSVIAPLVTAVCKIVVVIVSFVLLYLLFRLLICLIDRFFSFPVLGAVNRILGGVLGAAKGVIVVILVSFLASLAAVAFCEPDSAFSQAVEGSKAVEWVDSYNPIGELF